MTWQWWLSYGLMWAIWGAASEEYSTLDNICSGPALEEFKRALVRFEQQIQQAGYWE